MTFKGVDMPHHPRRIFRKLRKLEKEKKPKKARKKIPHFAPFKLLVETSCVVGFNISRATAIVSLDDPLISFTDITMDWADTAPPMQVAGMVKANLDTDKLEGTAQRTGIPRTPDRFSR